MLVLSRWIPNSVSTQVGNPSSGHFCRESISRAGPVPCRGGTHVGHPCGWDLCAFLPGDVISAQSCLSRASDLGAGGSIQVSRGGGEGEGGHLARDLCQAATCGRDSWLTSPARLVPVGIYPYLLACSHWRAGNICQQLSSLPSPFFLWLCPALQLRRLSAREALPIASLRSSPRLFPPAPGAEWLRQTLAGIPETTSEHTQTGKAKITL